jgi:enterochelin esterase family protein
MGAGQAMQIGFSNLDKFAYIGSFSGGMRSFDPKTSFAGVFADAAVFNKKVKLFWIGSGDQDNFYAGAKGIHEQLDQTGVHNVWFECSGGHEWQVWRKSLHDFAPRLFRN